MPPPETRYAKAGDLHIAYQVLGNGPVDLILNFGFASHLDLFWTGSASHFERLASFSRLIIFDKRGVGLSDRLDQAPTLEDRMEDLTAVMDAAGSKEAFILGISEGAAMAALFAATYPKRTSGLILYGTVARATWAPDYPWPPPREDLLQASAEFVQPAWGTGATVEIFAPSHQDNPEARAFHAQLERNAASPGMLASLFTMFLDIDVRHVLPTISVPTLVLHRRGDRVVNVRVGRWVAEQIPNAKYVELQGIDHLPLAGDADSVMDEVETFVTGVRPTREPDRVLATVLLTDIVGSTDRAVEMGDAAWRQLLETHYDDARAEIERHRGRMIKTLGDGVLATFDGPARGIRCADALVEKAETRGYSLRAGLHTGECEVIGEDIGGVAVHIASRISSLAGTREVLVSRTVTDLVAGSGLQFEERGRHSLKGVPGEWELFAVA
ncbi:MAG: adenylate/guanylate cyclase domain-containing protein [Actinomycetota bacterium]